MTGIAIILKDLFEEGFMSSVFIYISNAILLVIGFLVFGKEFLFKTLYGSILLPTIILVFEIMNINPASLFEIEMKYKRIYFKQNKLKFAIKCYVEVAQSCPETPWTI